MRNGFMALLMLLCSITPAAAQVDVAIGLPGVHIGLNVPLYPRLVLVPGYPVYYAPEVGSNYFFYDGMYWLYSDDNWYMSSWYNGPWELVAADAVPLFILRVPVRYYRRPPAYFRGWSSDAPPRWGEHWGHEWEQSHNGWDRWDRRSVPAPAPLPTYQRQYSGNRYPSAQQQQVLLQQNYRYQPHEANAQLHYRAQEGRAQATAPNRANQGPSQARGVPQQNSRSSSRVSSAQQGAPAASQHTPQYGTRESRPAAVSAPRAQSGHPVTSYQGQQAQPTVARHEQATMPVSAAQKRGPPPETKQVQSRQPKVAAAPRQDQVAHRQPPQVQHQQQATRSPESEPKGKGPAQEPKQGQEVH